MEITITVKTDSLAAISRAIDILQVEALKLLASRDELGDKIESFGLPIAKAAKNLVDEISHMSYFCEHLAKQLEDLEEKLQPE